MKITLDQATLEQAVISYLRNVGVQSGIGEVDFRYTRVPYTVFAEVTLIDAPIPQVAAPMESKSLEPLMEESETPEAKMTPLVDPDTIVIDDTPEEPPPEAPAAPLFGAP